MESSGPRRRFPAPWSFAKTRHGYEVRDSNGILLVSIYARDDLHTRRWADYQKYLTSDEARRIAKAVARIPELLNRHHPGFEASDNPHWSKSYPYLVALANCYVQENYDWIAACCARNAVPFERTGGVIEVEGGRWCVYKFVRQQTRSGSGTPSTDDGCSGSGSSIQVVQKTCRNFATCPTSASLESGPAAGSPR